MTRSSAAQDVRRLVWALCLAFATAGVWVAAQSSVTLSTPASPSAGQPGVHVITLTGSNFPAGTIQPADITVTLRPATPGTGATGSTPAATIATIFGTSRRVTFTIPTTIAVVSPVAYLASIAGRTTTGVSFSSTNAAALTVNPPPQITALAPASSSPGASVAVAITTILTNFVQGATQANFGPGVSVGGGPDGGFGLVTVASPTSATAQLTIAATAPPGPATVTVKTGVQTATLAGAFTIATPPPTNHAPVVSAGAAQTITLPAGVALSGVVSDDGLPGGATLTSNWTRSSGPGAVTFADASSPATTATFDQAGTYVLQLTASDSQLTSHDETTVIVLPRPNRPPTITSAAILTGAESQLYSYQAAATDPDGDAIAWRLVTAPDGMTIDSLGAVTWTPAHDQTGAQAVVVEASDGRGGTDTQTYSIAVAAAVRLSSIDATPEIARFSELGATRAVTVTGTNSDGSTVDLTHAPETTYESSSPFVAAVDADGTVHAVASGSATITVRNGQFADTAAVVVEPGVTLDALELTPPVTTLRTVGGSIALMLRGLFSDGEARDLTAADGTVYTSSAAGVATIGAGGGVTAIANGDATITARYDTLSATAVVHVAVSAGTGFLRGQVLDDSTGLPLAAADVQLIADGGGPLTLPTAATADDHGRFVVPGRAGDAVVRVTKAGFTVVERVATISAGGALTLLDTRLTPINSRANQVASVFGGTATDAAGTLTLTVAPGSLPANADLRLTPVSGQGLQGRLPFGWSPVAAVDIGPAGLTFAQPASLVASNAANLASGTPVVVAAYDAFRHQWISSGTSQVGVDGRSIPISVGGTGQIVCLVADAAPFTPAVSTTGGALDGSASVTLPGDVAATGQVIPRSAPPGDQARAVGSVLLQSTTPLPSGTVVQASVTERFDLTNQTQIVPRSFTEDLVLYSRGRPSGDGILGASFPITPSRSLSIQELLHGVVSLDVGPPATDVVASIVGAGGGVVTNAAGDSFEVSAAALTADTVIDVQRVSASQTLIGTPSGFDLLATLDVDLVGVTLAQPGRLSIAAPSSVSAGDQVLLAMVVEDPLGALGLRLMGVATLQAGRLVSQTAVGALNLPGPSTGGQYVFLRSQQPVGFVTGRVFGIDGTTPHSQALVTSDTAPFADVSSGSGGFIVAGRAGADVAVRALDAATSDVGTRAAHVAAVNEVVAADVALVATSLRITASFPSANATNVALDTSLSVDFSAAIDPASVTASNASLQTGGASVAGQLTLSADHKRLVFQPGAPLLGKTGYTLTLAGIRTASGRALSDGATLSFTTVDPSKPTLGQSGLITGDLPDDDGLVLVTGNAGAAEATSPVTATNLSTQATTTVLANTDGSFRLRVPASIGDEIALTLSDASGRSTTLSLTQLRSADGTTTVSAHGGTIVGAQGRVGTILPRALTQPGLFRLDAAGGNAAPPSLPDGFTYADQFHFSSQAAQFNTLASLSLTESQNRFAPQSPTGAPFDASGELSVPADFLVNASLHFTALALDASGVRRTAAAATLVVSGNAQTAPVESSQSADFPTVFVTSPAQALQNQLVDVHAVAPAARVDLELPSPAGADPSATLLLVRSESISGEAKLSVVDTLTSFVRDGVTLFHTTGHEFPGMSVTGDYAVVASRDPLVFVTGRLTGAPSVAALDGSPFVFETGGPNGSFALPTPAGQSFAIHYSDAVSGASLGTSTGQAPAAGSSDLGQPLAPPAALLTVAVEPDAQAIVDINQPLTFHFSEPVDARTLSGGIVVTDDAGLRVLGTAALASDAITGTFKPTRRWRFGTTYRWGVATSVLAVSGARLAQQASGAFTTFVPRVVSTTAVGTAHDVAVAGPLATVATDAGLAAVDVSSLVAPVVQAQAPLGGGAHGIALMPGTTFTDRAGQPHSGTFAAVAAGDASGPGRLEVFDVSAASAPIDIGSSQLTTGGGVPGGVAVTADQRALVPVQGTGVFSVHVPDAVPADPANPTHGLGPRYPASSLEGVNQTAILGDRVVAAGAAGLTVLDATTLARRGGISTTGDARGVAVLPAFSMDLNGDGVIAANETFDLAVVANGADGTLQFYSVPSSGDPVLLSVVHFTGETTSVALDATERMAYVALGARGMALVDLDGPASIQPIDADRNGTDDRVLGLVDTPGTASRLAPALDRGVVVIADGSAGVTVAQVLPPRTKFLTLVRDPILGHVGDEESILGSRVAFTTDDAVEVSLSVLLPPQEAAVLVLGETSGNHALTFADGSTVAPIAPGLNSFTIKVAHGASPASVSLSAKNQTGAALATLQFSVALPDVGDATLKTLFIAPGSVVLPADIADLQVEVGGLFTSGRVFNLTGSSAGSTYALSDTNVATVNGDGLVSAVAGGTAELDAQNGALTASAAVEVDRAPALVGLETSTPLLTLIHAGTPVALDVVGRFSDRSTQEASGIAGTQFTSSAPDVVGVTNDGVVTAVADGGATITVSNGAQHTQIQVTAELVTAPALTGITLTPVTTLVSADDAAVDVAAVVRGTGTLAGLSVTFSVDGVVGVSADALTTFSGDASASLVGLTSTGTFTLRASVVDPATGTTLTDTRSVTVLAAAGDSEPNDSNASASRVTAGATSTGTLDGATDARDVYRLDTSADGSVTVSLNLAAGTAAQNVVLTISDANGNEVARLTPTQDASQITATIPAGAAFISVQATTGAVSYSLSFDYDQAPLVIASVNPLAGGPGTLVTVNGTGFSTNTTDTSVMFGRVAGKLVSVSANVIQVLVPANGVNGPIQVVSGAGSAAGPIFTTGLAAPPAGFVQPTDPAALRQDPVSGATVDITRLLIQVDPLAARSQIDQLASALGGAIVGVLPFINSYVVSFAGNQTFAGLEVLRQQLVINPLVVAAVPLNQSRLATNRIDIRENGGLWAGTDVRHGTAFERVSLYEALDAIRRTPPFDDSTKLRPVRIAIIDSGFNPFLSEEFISHGSGLQSVVTYLEADPVLPGAKAQFNEHRAPGLRDRDNHGTGVAGIVAALNNGTPFSGVVGGLVSENERPPFSVLVYNCSGSVPREMDGGCELSALHDLAVRLDADPMPTIVNMSFGAGYGTHRQNEFSTTQALWKQLFNAFSQAALFVVAAGNEGVYANHDLPSAAAAAVPNGISVGATDLFDLRADWDPQGHASGDVPCARIGPFRGSNCGPLTLAAPGTDVFTTSTASPGYTTPAESSGTSVAAPIVTGVAALLETIRHPEVSGSPSSAPLITPADLKKYLVGSADDISSSWMPQAKIGRLDALSAVRKVLPPATTQKIYVSDSGQDSANLGHLVGIEVDPLTGERLSTPFADSVIPLSVLTPVLPPFSSPTGSVIAASSGNLYVLARGAQFLGDGIIVVNTHSGRAASFIALKTPGRSTPVALSDLRVGLTLSKDERLLYVAGESQLFIINTVSEKVVLDYDDLPDPYRLWDPQPRPADTLATRLFRISEAMGRFQLRRLAMSEDGKTLYCMLTAGTGTGDQPGLILPINVDLHADLTSDNGSQSNLNGYLAIGTQRRMEDENGAPIGDEPSAIVSNPAGGQVYLANGGAAAFTALPQGGDAQTKFAPFVDPLILGDGAAGAAGNLDFVINTAQSGATLLDAPGLFGAFGPPPTIGAAGTLTGVFPSEVVFGWQPSPDSGPVTNPESGLIVNQFNFSQVYAKRPFGIAMRPDGARALISFFQTGNFGVLDSQTQTSLPGPPAPAVPGLFTALVGVTQSLQLDSYLIPSRGAFTSPSGTIANVPASPLRVPSPDEALLFPGSIQYAQNGSFAVAVHAGNKPPAPFAAVMPDFLHDEDARKALVSAGFSISPGAASGTDQDGAQVFANATYKVDRGGGALSIIKDGAITTDFQNNAQTTASNRPYYSTRPICATPSTVDAGCSLQPLTHLFEYVGLGGVGTQFNEPRGVSIQPFASIETPRSGDAVTIFTPIVIRWRDARATSVTITLKDLATAPAAPALASLLGRPYKVAFSPEELQSQSTKLTFAQLARGVGFSTIPKNHLYRVEVTINSGDASSPTPTGSLISSMYVDVRF